MLRTIKCLPLLASLALGGCITAGSSSFRDMSSAYRDVLETYANDNILLNIARASNRMPVSFLEMPSVVGTGSVNANAGVASTVMSLSPSTLGGFLSGAAGSSYGPSVGLSVNNSFNFTQSSLDNAAFMTSFLGDIKPETVAALSSNLVAPIEVILSLVIDSIEIRDAQNHIVNKYVNNPSQPGYEAGFQALLYGLVAAGIQTEQSLQQMALSPPMDAETINRQIGTLGTVLGQPGVTLQTISKPGARPMYQVMRSAPVTNFCLNKQMTGAIMGNVFSDAAYCKTLGINPSISPISAIPAHGKVSLFINTRSTRNVFDYLGTLVNLQNQDPPRQVLVRSTANSDTNSGLVAASSPKPMLVMEVNKSSSKTLASVTYRGKSYSVPEGSDSWTQDVLVTLAQLLTLNKVPGSIPASPSVLIK